MSVCKYCNQEMTDANTRSCTETMVEFPDGTKREAILYHDEDGKRCHDCGIAPGGTHHPGCDWERCGGQLIACGCLSISGEAD